MFTYKEQSKEKGTPYQRVQAQFDQTGQSTVGLHRQIRDQANSSSFDLGTDRNDFSRTRDDQEAAFKPKYDDFQQTSRDEHRRRKQADASKNMTLAQDPNAKFNGQSTVRADFSNPRARATEQDSAVTGGGRGRREPPKSQFNIGQTDERFFETSQRHHFPQHTDTKQPVGAGRKAPVPSYNVINGESRDDKKSSYEGYTEGKYIGHQCIVLNSKIPKDHAYNPITGSVDRKRPPPPQQATVPHGDTSLGTLAALRPPTCDIPPMVNEGMLVDPQAKR